MILLNEQYSAKLEEGDSDSRHMAYKAHCSNQLSYLPKL